MDKGCEIMEKIQIPLRKVTQIKQFHSESDYTLSRNKYDKAEEPLEKLIQTKALNYTSSPREQSDFYVFVAQNKDTIRTSQDVHDALKQTKHKDEVILNPRFSVEHVSEFLCTRKLIARAKELGYWTMPPFSPNTPGEMSKYILDIVFKIAGVLCSLFALIPEEVIRSVVTNDWLQNLSTSTLQIMRIVCAVIFAAVLFRTATDWQKRRTEALRNADRVIGDLDEENFRYFIDGFSDHDFRFPKAFRRYNRETLFLCALSEYSFKECCVLYRYWMTSTEKQFWCIFMEICHHDFPFTTQKSKTRNLSIYRIEKLTQEQKRTLWDETGRIRFYAPSQDFGVDYILSGQKKQIQITQTGDITSAIEDFRNAHPELASIDLKMLMYLVTDMGQNMKIDMSIRPNRHAIFEYNPGTEPYRILERNLEKDVLFLPSGNISDNDLKLIPRAVGELRHYFSEWPAYAFENESPLDCDIKYIQLSILKAVSNRNSAGIQDVFMGISNRIINEFAHKGDYPEQYRTREWVVILQRVIAVFQAVRYRPFLPMLLHHLLWVCEGSFGNRPSQICADPAILTASRDNLFINHNTDALGLTQIDAVRDHYRAVSLAAHERNPAYNLEQSNRAPDSFDLLNLSAKERTVYYNALVYLEEHAVIKLYEYLYDLYCGTICDVGSVRFLNGANLQSEVQRKYPGQDGKSQEKKALLHTILEHVMGHVQTMYQGDKEVADALLELHRAWNLPPEKKHGKMLFLLAKYELKGLSAVSLLLCMSALLTGDREVTKQIYVDYGNDLFRMVFLTYHQTVIGNTYHDDIVYLLRLLWGYGEPSGILLSYLSWMGTHTLPNAVRAEVDAYLTTHKQSYVNQLQTNMDKLSRNDIEAFISYVISNSFLNEAEMNSILDELAKNLLKRYPEDSSMDILLELISMITKQCMTERLHDRTTEQVLSELTQYEPDTVYLFYREALKYDRESYLNNCHIVARQMLISNYVTKWIPVSTYIRCAEDTSSDGYQNTGKTYIALLRFHSHLNGHITPFIYIIDKIKAAIEHLNCLFRSNPSVFSFANEQVKDHLYGCLENNRTHIIRVETRAEYRQRLLKRNGIAVYLQYLIENSGLNRCISKKYDAMSQEERENYLIENHMQIRPFPPGEHQIYQEYCDMLRMLLQGGSPLETIGNQYEWLLRLAEDCKKVAEVVMGQNKEGCEEILQMLDAYVSYINHMDRK